MDMADSPDAMPVSSQTLSLKPENQNNLTKSNGSRNIRLHIPDYIKYWLPSQSNFSFNLTMSGRGCPIPSRDAGMHSLFNVVRSHDGTGSHLLEEVLQYNTLIAQQFLYTRSQGVDAGRAEYEGQQLNDSCDENLYWALDSAMAWSGGTVVAPPVARNVNCLAPLHTKLYDTESYIPVEAIGGIRLELQLDNYLRSIEYTTGSLAIGQNNACPLYPMAILGVPTSSLTTGGFELPAVGGAGGEPAVPLFSYGTPGTNYILNNIYSFSIGGTVGGYIQVIAIDGAGGISAAEIYCLGDPTGTLDVPQPVQNDILVIGFEPGPAPPLGTAASLTVLGGCLPIGDGRVANHAQNLRIPLWAENGAGTMTNLQAKAVVFGGGALAIPSPTNLATRFGANTLRDPFRNPTPRASVAYAPKGCYPNCRMPFAYGDRVYYSRIDGSGEVELGVCAGMEEYFEQTGGATQMPMLIIKPDRPLQDGVISNAVAAPTKKVGASPFVVNQADTHLLEGMQVYVKDADRVDGFNLVNIPVADYAGLSAAAGQAVDFLMADFEYQVKQIDMPDSVSDRDLAATNSGAGLQIDLETTQTSFVNVAQIAGPTSQLISLPLLTKVLGTISVPLNQNEQRGLEFLSLRGFADGMTSYQYEVGQAGLTPSRPVLVDKSSLGNPLVQAQAVNEKMKVCDSFGYAVSNLNQVGMNFSVGRQFSRPNMYFDLMSAGDLILNSQYDAGQTSPKLFIHFTSHLRSINISSNGMQIMN